MFGGSDKPARDRSVEANVAQAGRGQLGSAVSAANPRPVDPDPAAAEGDSAGLGAVADRGPVKLMAALGADQLLDISLQQAVQHP
jgi:hypothetical protein